MSFKIEKGSYTNTLDSASLSGNQTITLPNATGTVALTNQLAKVATSGSYNDLSNKPSIPSTPQGYVTQTWRSGNNWYRVWSDGFIEQGGYVGAPSSVMTAIDQTVNFNRSYSSTNYTVLAIISTGHTQTWALSTRRNSKSQFAIGSELAASIYPRNWYAAGY